MPSACAAIFMSEHSFRYGQSVTSAEVQQQNSAWVQIRGPFFPIMPLQVSLSLATWALKSLRRRRESQKLHSPVLPLWTPKRMDKKRIATPACRLSLSTTPELKRVQPLSRWLFPEPLLCVEVRPTIPSQNFSISCTSSFPNQTFHVPRTSFCSQGLDRQGPCLPETRNDLSFSS